MILCFYHIYIKPHIDKKTRKSNSAYFLLHFLFNSYIVSNILTDLVNLFNNPLDIHLIDSNLEFFVFIFHLYHWFLYSNLGLDEIIHHVVMIFIIIPISFAYCTNIVNFSLFFLTGLPGGITYLLLFLKDLKIISDIFEKKNKYYVKYVD